MAATAGSDIKTRFNALTSEAYLDVLLPESTDHDLSKLFQGGSGDKISRIPSRRNLFFDEQASLSVLLKTSIDEEELRDLLPSLDVTVAAHATDAVPQGSGNAASASGKHDLTSKVVPGSDAADVATSGDSVYAIWKPKLHLVRPRVRLQRPAIYFTAYLSINTEAMNKSKQKAAEFMDSFEPLPANVLESLHFDPSLTESKIHLSETIVTKGAAAATRPQDEAKPVKGASKRAFPIIPALFSRVRYSALPAGLVASLHLETSRLISGSVVVREVNLNVRNAKIEDISCLRFPIETRAADEIVALYSLIPNAEPRAKPASPLSVKIQASLCRQGVDDIDVEINWGTQVDLSLTVIQPEHKWSRPLSAGSQQAHRASLKEAERPSFSGTASAPSSSENGMIFNFTAPPTVHTKEIFQLHVQCINRSERSRRFALLSLQAKKKTTKGQIHSVNADDANAIATLFNAPLFDPPRSPDVRDLNPDVRVGPLPPRASFETDMKFQAMTTGVLDLGVLRIVDLDTRRTVDVKDLPDVVALAADERGG